jgi:hypothetical protein
MLVAQPVCHSAFDGDVRLGKYYARIIRDGIFLRILAGIDRSDGSEQRPPLKHPPRGLGAAQSRERLLHTTMPRPQ